MGMRHEERVEILREGHRALLEKLDRHSVEFGRLPSSVIKEKLESAYDRIDNEYEWVLRKKSGK